jgi:hypothetical protein
MAEASERQAKVGDLSGVDTATAELQAELLQIQIVLDREVFRQDDTESA